MDLGTKGGFERYVTITQQEQIELIEQLKKELGPREWMIPRPTQKQALARYHYIMRKAGITRKQLGATSHGLRYTYTQELEKDLMDKGHTLKQARSTAAVNLGHGGGRTTFVKNVYENK